MYEHEITQQQAKKDIANAASKAKSDFLARVSHEVRTPLNGVLGMSELMLDTQMNAEQTLYTESIMTSGKHLLGIINDILDLSKIEAGKLELEEQPLDLLELVDEVIGIFASQSKSKHLLFICYFNHSVNRYRIGDAIKIKQILFNLLSNAFKFTKKGKVLLTVCESKENNNIMQFTIKDTGIGIDNKLTENLFKPFVQADSATTRKYGGTGLGLAIVKQLVEKMQGTIIAKGEVGIGSEFLARIPMKINTNNYNKQLNYHHNNQLSVCVLIQDQNLKQSLIEYLTILNVIITSSLDDNNLPNHLFIDTVFELNEAQDNMLSLAIEKNVTINFIDFNKDSINSNNQYNKNLPANLLEIPLTFNKIRTSLFSIPTETKNGQQMLLSSFLMASLKILVIEDNAVNQHLSIEMLEKMGHLVDVVDNAEEASNMLHRDHYDLLLVDYHLPGIDGLSLIKNWQNPKSIPIIVVTADLTDEVFQKCHQLNINNIVAKPYTQKTLSEAIEKALA